MSVAPPRLALKVENILTFKPFRRAVPQEINGFASHAFLRVASGVIEPLCLLFLKNQHLLLVFSQNKSLLNNRITGEF